jgi:hypothetical protein
LNGFAAEIDADKCTQTADEAVAPSVSDRIWPERDFSRGSAVHFSEKLWKGSTF